MPIPSQQSIILLVVFDFQKEEKKELTGREQKNEQKRIKLEHKLKRPDGELVFKVILV